MLGQAGALLDRADQRRWSPALLPGTASGSLGGLACGSFEADSLRTEEDSLEKAFKASLWSFSGSLCLKCHRSFEIFKSWNIWNHGDENLITVCQLDVTLLEEASEWLQEQREELKNRAKSTFQAA